MKPSVQPLLVNDVYRDPVLYLDFLFERRALLFDVGDIRNLKPRQLLRVSHLFVSHTHMDHFADFDWLLRICLGRALTLHLFGPAGFIDRLQAKLGAYSWNLVGNYTANLRLNVTEMLDDGYARRACFECRSAFRREDLQPTRIDAGVVVDEKAFRVRAAVVDHGIPCLAFAFEEKLHVNIWKNRLSEMGLPTGPWLTSLKEAVLDNRPDDTAIRAWWRDQGELRQRWFSLGELRTRLVRTAPGIKLGYVVDMAFTPANRERIVNLVQDAQRLYIEAPFLHREADRAARKSHLTARQAGWLARDAGVRELVPIHFSPRNSDQQAALLSEAREAFEGEESDATE